MISHIYIVFFFIATIYVIPYPASPNETCPGEISLRKCLNQSGFKGPAYFRYDRRDLAYNVDLGIEYNLRVIYFPVAFVHPLDESDVSIAIQCGKNFSIVARSGGHSFESYSIGSENCTLVVDLINFNEISIDEIAETVVVGAGNRLGTLYYELNNSGFAFPSGSCVDVGVGGIILGGGEGLLARKFGMSSDNILDAKIVLANGSIIENASDYHDLFWALQGAGNAGYGIVTSLKLKIYRIPERVTFMDFKYEASLNAIKSIYSTLNKLGQAFDQNLSMEIIHWHPENLTSVRGLYLGPESNLNEILQEFIEGSKPIDTKYYEEDWFSTIVRDASFPMRTVEGAKHPRNTPAPVKVKSFYVNNSGLSPKGVESLFNFMWEVNCPMFIDTTLYGGGSHYNDSRTGTAFVHRGFMYHISIGMTLPISDERLIDEKCLTQLKQFAESFQETYTSNESYQNVIDKELDKWQCRYYGENFKKLVEIKRQYDPYNLFNWAQSIPRTSEINCTNWNLESYRN
ncbi:8944_t:CDS:2 [Racocetra persica]|uniref:8944_t:CDS:1 n=1 Tax=Racocetra persica TaxID=160502 RepID=A0ACA9MMB5_9GLOM|nr:8944_t:CDS:2 [Racocetra persica]